jgi:hypothetical protein
MTSKTQGWCSLAMLGRAAFVCHSGKAEGACRDTFYCVSMRR